MSRIPAHTPTAARYIGLMHPSPYATDITSVFGRTLAALRAEAGLSQTDLANQMKMDRTAVARLEIGRTTLSVPVVAAAEQILLSRQAIRQPGDLTVLSARVTERLLAQGVMVCVDRPPADKPILLTRTLILAVRGVILAWSAELRAEGLRFGEPPEPGEQVVPEPARLVIANDRLHTSRARPAEIAQRLARTDAA